MMNVLQSRLKDALSALLGVSTYSVDDPVAPTGRMIDDPAVEETRRRYGGQITPLIDTPLRWYLADIEDAQQAADSGDLSKAARLWRAMKGDGILSGHLEARVGKAVRLPRRWTGDPTIVRELQGRDGARSVYEDMFPASELELLAGDGFGLGVGVGEMVPVAGRSYPVLVRHEPEFLRYRWNENRWYYLSVQGPLWIRPGDGRWILHTPGGRLSPWNAGKWRSLANAWIPAEHSRLHLSNWEAKLANAARAAVSPQGATEEQHESWFQSVMAWGVNTVFGMKPGYDVKLIESNGRGYESFAKTIERSERIYAITICGQVVTSDGGAGFSNADVPERVLDSLVDKTAEAITYTINTQGTPQYVVQHFGEAALARMPIVTQSVEQPKDLISAAQTMTNVAAGMAALRQELALYNRTLDINVIVSDFQIPIAGDVDGDGVPDADGGPIDAPSDAEAPSPEARDAEVEAPANDIGEAA